MWEQTDDLQFVKIINENEFEIIETTWYPDESYGYSYNIINIKDYNDDDLEKEIKYYYHSMAEVKEIYGGDWKMVVAEIIAENNNEVEYRFANLNKLKENLFSEYGIEIK